MFEKAFTHYALNALSKEFIITFFHVLRTDAEIRRPIFHNCMKSVLSSTNPDTHMSRLICDPSRDINPSFGIWQASDLHNFYTSKLIPKNQKKKIHSSCLNTATLNFFVWTILKEVYCSDVPLSWHFFRCFFKHSSGEIKIGTNETTANIQYT